MCLGAILFVGHFHPRGEGSTLTQVFRFLSVCRYLHTLTRMIHILLKTLENYSKSTDYMYVRKKRIIAKKKAEKATTEGNE